MKSKLLVLPILCMFLLASSGCLPSCTICGLPPACPTCQRYTATVQWFKDNLIETTLVGFDGCVVVHSNRDKTCSLIVVVSIQPLSAFPITAVPESFDLNGPPGAFDFYGEEIYSSYGTPVVDYYDGNGWVDGFGIGVCDE